MNGDVWVMMMSLLLFFLSGRFEVALLIILLNTTSETNQR